MKTALFLVGAVCVGVAWNQQITSKCPDGWLAWQNFCYLFSNSSKVTWQDAGDECAVRRSHLLRVETIDEYNFVKKGLLMYPADAYWTALNDLPLNQPKNPNRLRGTGTFMWGSDELANDAVVGQHWDKEPDNTDFKDCVTISIQGTMAVEDCNNRHGYVCQVTKDITAECPVSNGQWWIPNGDGTLCYFFSNVSTWQNLVTWDQARKMCESMSGGHATMLAITSTTQQTFLAAELPQIAYTRQQYWTGLNDKNREGSFIWAGNDGTPFNGQYVKWRVEPNNLAGKEFCGAILPGGEWNDRNCDDKLYFACRLNLPDAPQEWSMGCGSWTRAGQKCIAVYSVPKLTWQDARSHCLAMSGDLMKFDNEDDTMWLSMQSSASVLTLPGYWIGLNDMKTENTFVWADGSYAPGYLLDWDVEPNNFARWGRFTQNCAVMAVDGNFIDLSCNRQKAGAICEEMTTTCAAGWQSYGKSCYLFDTTFRFKREARLNCNAKSATGFGHLFALNTQDEKNWLVSQIGKLSNPPYAFWSALTDNQLEGEWHYPIDADDDPEAIKQLVTWASEPNNFGGNEDCVQVDMNGHLNDARCSLKSGFVCQRYLTAGAPPVFSKIAWPVLLSLLACLLL